VRHGLTAETVLSALEDAEDYKAFEAAIIADYDAQSAVERELVLRLASILWRLRRATTMETGLFDIQAQQLQDYRQNRQLLSNSREVIHTAFRRAESASGDAASLDAVSNIETLSDSGLKGDAVGFARCFLRLANLPNFALDRLSRYEALLWRQAGRILHALEILDRRKTHERRRRDLAWSGNSHRLRMIAAFEIARLFRHDLTIFARGSQVALAMENIAAGNVPPSAFAVMRLRSSDLHFFTRERTSRAITVPRRPRVD
jgi:hypothetical protein